MLQGPLFGSGETRHDKEAEGGRKNNVAPWSLSLPPRRVFKPRSSSAMLFTSHTMNHFLWWSIRMYWAHAVRKVFRPLYFVHSLSFAKNQKSSFYFSLMFTQHPILTEKNRNVEIFANLLKKKNWNITWHVKTGCRVLRVNILTLLLP